MNRLSPFLVAMMALGFVFLYAPIASVVVYSFNASRLVTVWAGFSLQWYGALFENEAIGRAALVSLEVALIAATGALVLGTLVAYALARYRRFAGRTLFAAMATAPLVMPEIIAGLSLLLLFVALEQATGWPQGRGIATIAIAHITLGIAFVAVIVEARLAAFDRALEEAALDLGARPTARVFYHHPAADRAGIGGRLVAGVHPVVRRFGDRELHRRPGLDHFADGDFLQRTARRQSPDQRASDIDLGRRDRAGGRREPPSPPAVTRRAFAIERARLSAKTPLCGARQARGTIPR